MLTASMVSRPLRRWLATAVFAGLSLTIGACQKVPLLAPTGSTITLTAGSTALSVNGTTDIIAQVVEAAGTAPQDGTSVTFTTTLGSIEPLEARTNGGRVTVKFRAGTANGTAIITASSGAASASGHRTRPESQSEPQPSGACASPQTRHCCRRRGAYRRLPARLSTSTAIRSVLLRSRSRRLRERSSRSPFRRMQAAWRALFSEPRRPRLSRWRSARRRVRAPVERLRPPQAPRRLRQLRRRLEPPAEA